MAKRKNGKKHVPIGFTRHHREPKSLGGKNVDSNISIVPRPKHEAWTTLFDNLPALRVAELFEEYHKEFGNRSRILNEAKQIGLSVLREVNLLNEYGDIFAKAEIEEIHKVLTDHRLKAKKINAWLLLFRGKSLEEIVSEINEVWLDPKYKFVIEFAQVKRIVIKKL